MLCQAHEAQEPVRGPRHLPRSPARPGAFLLHGVPAVPKGRPTGGLFMYRSRTPAKPPPENPTQHPAQARAPAGWGVLKTPFVSSWTRLGTLEDRVKPGA